jgi:hypothetical protein
MKNLYLAIFLVGGFICVMNFYLSFVRYALSRIVHGRNGYRHISGFPIIGSLLVVASLLVAHMPRWISLVGLTLAALDTGGIHWFIGVVAWHHIRSADASQRGS